MSIKLSDQEILDLFKNDTTKEKGFSLLVRKYQEKIYWHVRRLVVDHDDANDVCQNIFIKVWTNLDKFKENSQLYTWLYRIATNESLTFLNQKRKKDSIPLATDDYDIGEQLAADPYFEGDALQVKLQKAIAALPEKQRVVFLMRYYDETKYEDMSEMLDTSVGALKASYHHAAKKIEKYLTEG
ncbi:MAG: RNA polymerase sigma factor [Chitinophagales bacterium]|jgi:RNA polymerase sigma-70 factor (ECF subfamily)|nr:RNA polymerase sigma factor [Sphingobacteriales bacterium]MBP7534292.1 RNA polymerase sigma factor [Chitinophagales bacterium]